MKYFLWVVNVILVIVLIVVANYASDLSNDYKKFKNQFIDEKQNYVFLGDSITHGYDLDEFYDYKYLVNSGINGDTTRDILDDMKNRVYIYNPTKIFLLIGINDLGKGKSNEKILRNIKSIVLKIKKNRPYAKIYIESVYPLSKKPNYESYRKIGNDRIKKLNVGIEKICKEYDLTYIDVFNSLIDEKGNLKEKYTSDGLHLNGLGYHKVTKILNKYVKEQVKSN